MRKVLVLVLGGALGLVAQLSKSPAAIAHAQGVVYVNDVDAMPGVLRGDAAIRTGAGRAVIQLRRSGLLFLDENSSVRVVDNHPYNFNRIEMVAGSAVVVTGSDAGMVVCEDSVKLSDHAVIRLDLHGADCVIRLYEGAASAQLASVVTVLRAGKTMVLNRQCGDMIPWNDFDVSNIDGFYRWSMANR